MKRTQWKSLSGGRFDLAQFIAEDEGCSFVEALRRSFKTAHFCLDCGVDTIEIEHYYMLRNPLWLSINPQDDGMLCLNCVEARLGRALVPTDFAIVPVNDDLTQLLSVGKRRTDFNRLCRECRVRTARLAPLSGEPLDS